MFRKKITLQTELTRQDTIAVLSENVAPWHRDSSPLIFEGRVQPDGNFNFGLGATRTGMSTRVSIVEISGCVVGNEGGKTMVDIRFSVIKTMRFFIYVIPVIFIALSILLYTGVLSAPIPWFVPAGMTLFFMISLYLTFRADVHKAETHLRSLLT